MKFFAIFVFILASLGVYAETTPVKLDVGERSIYVRDGKCKPFLSEAYVLVRKALPLEEKLRLMEDLWDLLDRKTHKTDKHPPEEALESLAEIQELLKAFSNIQEKLEWLDALGYTHLGVPRFPPGFGEMLDMAIQTGQRGVEYIRDYQNKVDANSGPGCTPQIDGTCR